MRWLRPLFTCSPALRRFTTRTAPSSSATTWARHRHGSQTVDPISRTLDAVLARALAKDVDARYPTCLDFAHALTQQDTRSHAKFPPLHANSSSSGSAR